MSTSFTISQETAILYKHAHRAKLLYNSGKWTDTRTVIYLSRFFGSIERASYMFNNYVKVVANDKV